MNKAGLLKLCNNDYHNGEADHSHKPDGIKSEIHGHKGDDRGKTHLFADDFGFDNVSDHGYKYIEQQDLQPKYGISSHKIDNSPGNKHRSGSKHRHDVHNSDKEGKRPGIGNPEDKQTDKKLKAGYKENYDISPEHFKDIFHEKLFGVADDVLKPWGKLAEYKGSYSVIIIGNKTGGHNGDDGGEHKAGNVGYNSYRKIYKCSGKRKKDYYKKSCNLWIK